MPATGVDREWPPAWRERVSRWLNWGPPWEWGLRKWMVALLLVAASFAFAAVVPSWVERSVSLALLAGLIVYEVRRRRTG